MEHPTRIFIDTSKSVFQLHGVDAAERVVLRRQVSRGQLLKVLSQLPPTVIGLEACGGAHHWAREVEKLSHQARLTPPQYVKAYLKRNKNDWRDAEAGCEAISRPTMSFVPIKTEEEQAFAMLIGVRDGLLRRRTQLGNTIRGYAGEFGHVIAKGVAWIEPLLARLAADEALPALAREMFAELGAEWSELKARLVKIDKRLAVEIRGNEAAQRLMQVPGVGPIGAALILAKTPAPQMFKSARHYAAWMGLTPKDHSTAGKQRLGVITRAGDEALRAVLVSGAMSVVQAAQRRPDRAAPWLVQLLKRKTPKQAAVALANKMARIAWKMLVTGQAYEPERLNPSMPKAA